MAKLKALDIVRAIAPAMLGDGGGLWLQVRHNSKAWIFRYTLRGKAHSLGLGAASKISLKRARELAAEQGRLLAEGIDPLQHRRTQRAAADVAAAGGITFKEFAEDFIQSHQHAWRSDQHRRQWHSSLEANVYPVFGDVPVRDVTTPLVLKALKSIWHEMPETASRTRGRVERILNAAKAAGLRTGENAAQWKGHLEALLPRPGKLRKPVHFAALPYREVARFLQVLRMRRGMGARALEFIILTAARSAEVLGAKWGEIDMANRVWTIPGDRMKAGKEHRVPLSGAAITLLQPLSDARSSEYVFPGNANGKLGASTMVMVLELMGRKDITVHGFRSTFRDWAAEQTAYPNEVVEMALAHTIGNKVEAAYRRGDLFDKRARLMAAWGQYCGHSQASADVVAIRN